MPVQVKIACNDDGDDCDLSRLSKTPCCLLFRVPRVWQFFLSWLLRRRSPFTLTSGTRVCEQRDAAVADVYEV